MHVAFAAEKRHLVVFSAEPDHMARLHASAEASSEAPNRELKGRHKHYALPAISHIEQIQLHVVTFAMRGTPASFACGMSIE